VLRFTRVVVIKLARKQNVRKQTDTRGSKKMNLAEIVQRGWEAVGAGDFDTLVSDYVEDMTFIMPGQGDVLEGRQAFRKALDSLGEILPPGFEITGLRQIEGGNEVVSIVEWKSEKIADSQFSVLFKFEGDKIYEERWFLDTDQWKSAF
jgi:ketosteroid isomerase-like protein